MKHLTILRHAKSSWDDRDLDDVDRPLNDRGWKAARRMGRELSERGFRFDFVLASPAVRVRQTIDGVQEKFEFQAPIRFEQRMYLASAELLLQFLRNLPDAIQCPLLIGHNPGLHQLLLDVTNDSGPQRCEVQHKFPTAAIAAIDLPADRWKEVEPGTGQVAEVILPKELD